MYDNATNMFKVHVHTRWSNLHVFVWILIWSNQKTMRSQY